MHAGQIKLEKKTKQKKESISNNEVVHINKITLFSLYKFKITIILMLFKLYSCRLAKVNRMHYLCEM